MRSLLVVVALAACHKAAPEAKLAPHDAAVAPPKFRTAASKTRLDPALSASGKTFMVVSEAPLATKVGHDVLAAGGNAVDAAVATAFALSVVHPTSGNIAGGGFAIVRASKTVTAALDFRETAPAAATTNMYIDANGNATKDSLVGDRASGVPASVAGLWALHEKYGKTPWKELLAPAIALARDGFAVDRFIHGALVRRAARPGVSPAMAALWLPGNKARDIGEVVKNPELQATLERIADKGPPGFYEGPTAAAIVDEMKRGGGLITAKDLETYKPEWREPLIVTYRGRKMITMPPPSSGGIVVAMIANMMHGIDLGKLGWHSAQHIHELVEVFRRSFAARNEMLGDPAYVKDMPIAKLVSQEYADRLAATIGPNATPSKNIAPIIEGTHTTNLCVVDGAGMAVAMTTTLNTPFGNGVLVAGFFLNNEMDDFAAKPGTPNVFGLVQGTANRVEAGKRMLSSMSPTIVEDDQGNVAMVVGAQGGPRIITAVWQVISNVIDYGMSAAEAIASPRVHHQHLPDEVVIEDEAITQDADASLRAMGYTLIWNKSDRGLAAANTIVRTPAGWDGAADPRGGGAALGD